jgi:hypothetical protein
LSFAQNELEMGLDELRQVFQRRSLKDGKAK